MGGRRSNKRMIYRAGYHKALLMVVTPLCCGACLWAQQPSVSPAGESDLLFPFSTALFGREEREAARLKNLVERLDGVERAEVVVSHAEDGSPRALVMLTWRAGRPSAASAAWAADLALRVLGGLSREGLTVADASGRVWFGRQVVPPPGASEPTNGSAWIVVLGGVLTVVLGMLLVLWWHRHGRASRGALERPQVPISPQKMSKLLRQSSPALRGLLLAILLPEMGRAQSGRFGKGVSLPARTPEPEVLSAILAALGDEEREERR